MKSALLVMATLAEYRFLPIQVSTPKKESNLEHEERKEYDVVANWELNQDNEIGAENRCVEVRCINLMRLLKIDIIKKHLLSYDYSAALEVGKDIREDLSSRAFRWLEAAEAVGRDDKLISAHTPPVAVNADIRRITQSVTTVQPIACVHQQFLYAQSPLVILVSQFCHDQFSIPHS